MAAVERTYAESDLDRESLNQSTELRSQELIEANADLVQSREMFRLMAESTKAIPFTLDLTRGCFPYIGAQGVVDWGIPVSECKEPGVLDVIIPRESNGEVRQHFDECESGPFEFVAALCQRDNRRMEVRWTGTCEVVAGTKYLRGLMLDITELRRLARELTAAQKLESVGRLAAGVAHEINTPVQFVSDNVQFVGKSIADIAAVIRAYRNLRFAVQSAGDVTEAARLACESEIAADLDYVLEHAPAAIDSSIEGLERIATIVRSMKEFAHPDQSQKTFGDLNQAIRSTLVIAHNEYKYVADIDAQFGELPAVECYLGEINQVVLNLLVNASHAISDVVKDTGARGKSLRCVHGSMAIGWRSRWRYGHRHPRGGTGQTLRSVFHHQGSGQGDGTRAGHCAKRHRQQTRWVVDFRD